MVGRVLDVGCGNGGLAAYVAPDQYLGVDRDSRALADARANYPTHTFVEELPPEGSYDTVVALALIEHIKDAQGALQVWAQLLSDSGRIVLTTPHQSFRLIHDLGSRLGLFSKDAADEHEELFTQSSLADLAEKSALRIDYYKRFLVGANQLCILVPDLGTSVGVWASGKRGC